MVEYAVATEMKAPRAGLALRWPRRNCGRASFSAVHLQGAAIRRKPASQVSGEGLFASPLPLPLRTSSDDFDGLRATRSRMLASGFPSSAIQLCGSVSQRFLRGKKTKEFQGLAPVGCGPSGAPSGPFRLHIGRFSPELWTAGAEVRRLNSLVFSDFRKRLQAYFCLAQWPARWRM